MKNSKVRTKPRLVSCKLNRKLSSNFVSIAGSGAPSISSNSDKSETESSDVVTYQISRLTVTQDNTLLQYAHIDVDEGILLTPFKRQSFGQLEGLLMDNFLNAVRIMHCNFRSYSSQRTGGGKNHKWSSKSLAATKEQVSYIF